ncbi:MAG: hypothetical protein E7647_07630 [Ruminococcaceae bacterium]|nr:hypothetical protein [Oscillospiraceae bacterium]
MKKFIKLLSLALAFVIIASMTVSCGVEYTDEEVKEAAKKLIEASFEMNDIFFGAGLPISAHDSEEAKKFAESNDLDLKNIQFLPVTEESPYFSIEDIKEACAKVYSAEYCEYLYSMAFEGYSTDDGTSAVFAKYMEDESGVLTARIDLADNKLPERTYDFATMKVKERKKDSVMVEMESYLDGKKEKGTITFTLVMSEDGWRLDTPTY